MSGHKTFNLYHLYYAYFNTTSSFYICLNDTLVKGNAGDFSMQMASLGGIGGTGRYYLNGFIPELIAYNKSLSSIENYHINNYISDKYFPPVDLGKDTSLIYKQDSILSKDLSIYQSCIWSTGDTTPQITLKRGIYWVKVKDYFGRESIDTIMIGESYLEPLLKNNPYIFCPKDTLQIFYQELCQKENIPYYSNYSYQWSNGQSGSNFYTTEYGSYHLTITSPRGYSITATFDVMIDSFPSQVKILTDSLCVGNNVRLLYPSDSLFLYQIVWNKTDTIQQLPFLQTSQIYVEVTNQRGCVGRDTQLIISKGNAPIVSFTTANVCLNQVTEFTNNSYTTDTSVISDVWWNFGDNDSLYSNNATEKQQHLYDSANIYAVSLKCKTNLGCENSFRQTVAVYSLPKTDFSPKQGCEKTDFVFNNTTQSAYPIRKYLWTINDRDTMSAINPTCRFDSVGMIKVELIAESIWGCKDTIFHQVEIKPSPQPIMTYNSLCVGQNVNFLDNTPSTSTCPILARKWYVNNQQVSSNDKMTYMFSQDGQYQLQLQVQYLNGCMNQQTNLLTFYPKPKADFTVSQPCILQPLSIENKARVFTPNSFSTYAWHIDGMCFYDSLPQIKLKEAGTFLLTQVVTDEQGCSDTVEQTIQIYASPRADFTYQYNADNPYAIDFQHVNNNMDNVMYSWYFMDKDSSIEEYPIYDFEKEGDYQVRLIVNEENGTCKDTIDKLIHVEEVNIDLEFVNFSLQEENLGVRPIVWLLNKSNRNLAYMDYRFVYEQEWVQERDTTTLQIGTMNKYAFTALEKKQPTATHICIEAYSPYDMYKDSKLPETYCLVLTEQLQVFDIYPNPVNDRINVQFIIPEATTVEMKLCDMMGNVLYNDSQYYTSGVHYKTLSINEFASGVYVVQVCTKNRVVSKKIIKI